MVILTSRDARSSSSRETLRMEANSEKSVGEDVDTTKRSHVGRWEYIWVFLPQVMAYLEKERGQRLAALATMEFRLFQAVYNYDQSSLKCYD